MVAEVVIEIEVRANPWRAGTTDSARIRQAMDALLLEKLAILASNPICTNHSFLFKLRGKDLPVKDGYLQGLVLPKAPT